MGTFIISRPCKHPRRGHAALIMTKKNEPDSTFTSPFAHFFSSQGPLFSLTRKLWNPPVDIFEAGDRTVIRMEVAGLSSDDFTVTAEGRRLIVRGRRPEQKNDAIVCYHLMEVRYGEFERVFEFPYALRDEDVKATYEHGFLSIDVPKKSESDSTLTVEVIEETYEE